MQALKGPNVLIVMWISGLECLDYSEVMIYVGRHINTAC